MKIQIINLSVRDVFTKYCSRYNIFKDAYNGGTDGLELRDLSLQFADTIQQIVLKENQFCYKSKISNDKADLFVTGNLTIFKELSRKILSLGDEDLGYRIINVIKNYEEYDQKVFSAGDKKFGPGKIYLMGILNVTPDSFSDGGKFRSTDEASAYALKMLEDGADILDIGGESSRPGSRPVEEQEEINRVFPVIEKILASVPGAIISVDTTKSSVAEKALKAGAKIINDISSASFDNEMLKVVKKYNASIILMHMKGTPADMQINPSYKNLISEVYDFLYEKVQLAAKAGIKNILVDPGIGFGKSIDDNFELIKRLSDFKSLGYPIMIGLSRKGFIGSTLDVPVERRDTPTSMLEAVAAANGAKFIRTHNIVNGLQLTKLLNAMYKAADV